MKKIFALLMICSLVLLTGCGGDSDNKKSSNTEELKLGMIRHLNITETLLDNYFEKAASRMKQTADMRAPKHIFFDNMPAMISALQSGQIDKISTYDSVAKYLLAKNAAMEISSDRVPKVSDSFCCGLREDSADLKSELDAAILKLYADGTLANLVKTYITDIKAYEDLPAVDMPNFDGAETIKVAVTGDLPPLDYISADGKPAGFNTAMLAAISQQIGKNFELVDVDSGARAAALTSGQVDVVFWVAVPLNNTLAPPNCDKPDGMILTEAYFSDEITHVEFKE